MFDRFNIFIENVDIAWKNFGGHKDPATGWGEEGVRWFSVWIPDDLAAQLMDENYRVSISEPKHEGQNPRYKIRINVSYRFNKPVVQVGAEGTRGVNYSEDMLDELDSADLGKCDLILTASPSKKDGLNTFYLKKGRFNLIEDAWDRKYRYDSDEPEDY